jgi:hypothetical protein
MFKIGSFEDEICSSMEKQLVSNQLEHIHGFNKLAKAAEYLNSAAAIFEQAGMHQTSDDIIELLQQWAGSVK